MLGLGLIVELVSYSRGAWIGIVLGLILALGLSLLHKTNRQNNRVILSNRVKQLSVLAAIVIVLVGVVFTIQKVLPLPYPKGFTPISSSYSNNQSDINSRFKETFNVDNEYKSSAVRDLETSYRRCPLRCEYSYSRPVGISAIRGVR